MSSLKLPTLALTLLSCATLLAAPDRRVVKPRTDDSHTLTGILKSVDPRHGTFTLERAGVDVDDALIEMLKQRGRDARETKDGEAKQAEPVVVHLGSKAKIYIKFRSSPSIANNVEQTLADLERMVGWPVSATVGDKSDVVVAKEVIAWRGTPLRVR